MHRVAISSTGLYIPPDIITNDELVATFNRFADQENASHAADIAAGTRQIIRAADCLARFAMSGFLAGLPCDREPRSAR